MIILAHRCLNRFITIFFFFLPLICQIKRFVDFFVCVVQLAPLRRDAFGVMRPTLGAAETDYCRGEGTNALGCPLD
jgi:hypothetical protein